MRQYHSVKKRYPDALLLFQMGDFYETFHEDAQKLASTLNITLTTRGKDGDSPIPLAGFPIKAMDGYLHKLVAAGHRVVVCDQIEDPKTAKGVVKRDVVRIVTPGTVIEDSLLEPGRENFIFCLAPTKESYGVAWVELTTGQFVAFAATEDELATLLVRLAPAEIVVSDGQDGRVKDLAADLGRKYEATLSPAPDWTFAPKHALKTLKDHFGTASLGGFGFEREDGPELRAAGALLAYLKEQQRAGLTHIGKLEPYSLASTIPLDRATVAALEIVETMRGRARSHTLLWALDQCRTSMGSRLLRSWLLAPLRDAKLIRMRHGAVAELAGGTKRREMIREVLEGLNDIERLAGRVGCMRATPRDLVALAASLARVPLAHNALAGVSNTLLDEISRRLDPCADVVELIQRAVNDDPPVTLKEGGVIRDGFNAGLDELRSMTRDGRRYIAEFQAKEQRESGLPSLKVGYTSVFGYYLEITNTHKDKVPQHWIRKQTLKNAERYITPELKEIEAKVLNAESEALSLEQKLFAQLREQIATHAARMATTARLLAMLDVLSAFADTAVARNYVQPDITDDADLMIADGRHPVLELTLAGGRVVPNDCDLATLQPVMLITGPNMSGKSTYIRMVALLSLMAQAGSFVPATSMRLGVVDRIFTRIGSSDEIQKGSSTFMVEMLETANILNNASERSLIVLDEVGRGTSTFDGVSIAWAITEYLATRLNARTLFATHYHELTQLASRLTNVRNFNVAVREWGDEIVFLHKIVEGASDRSYGIHVAKLAGLPSGVIERSREILARLEKETDALESMTASNDGPKLKRPRKVQLALFTPAENSVMKALEGLDVDNLPPEVLRAELTRLKALAKQ